MVKLRYNTYVGGLFLFLAYFSIFNKPLAGLLGIDAIDYMDEVILVLGFSLLLVVVFLSSRISIVYAVTLIFLLYSIGISMAFGWNRDFAEVVLQSLINLKFIILLLTAVVIFRDRLDVLERFFYYVVWIALGGFILNLIFGTGFNYFFDMPIYRRPLVPLRYGGFLNPNHMAFLMALFIGMRLNLARRSDRLLTLKDWLLIAGSLLVIGLTDSRSALVGVLIFFVAFYREFMLRNAKIFLSFLVVAMVSIVAILFFSNLIESIWINLQGSFSLDSYYIRGIMINMAFQITLLEFPIGTGAATFGSVLSAGSPVYDYFGVGHRIFFIEQRGVYDSSAASILGEYGIMGILFYGGLFYALMRYFQGIFGFRSNHLLSALFWAFFFYSITNPTLTNNIYILLSIPVFVSLANDNRDGSWALREGRISKS